MEAAASNRQQTQPRQIRGYVLSGDDEGDRARNHEPGGCVIVRLCGRILVISAVAVYAAAADAQVTWPAVPHHELQSPPTGLDESSHKGVFDQRRAEDRGTEAIPFVVKELPRE